MSSIVKWRRRLRPSICNCRRYYFGGNCTFILLNLKTLAFSLLIWLANELLIKNMTNHFFIHNYLNDVLAMGILLPFSNLLLSLYTNKDVRLKKIFPITLFTIVVGLYWEYISPLYTNNTCDLFDIMAYLLGAYLYYYFVIFHLNRVSRLN